MSTETEGAASVAPEFSHEVRLEGLPKGGRHYALIADADARTAIAKRLKVPAIAALDGDMDISATRARIDVRGSVRAILTRECVASLEEMEERIDETFALEFLRQAPDEAPASDEDDDGLDMPEVHEAEILDIGEILVQQLSLAMDPFPRKDGAVSLAAQFGRVEERSPLADALKAAMKQEEK